LHELGIAEVVPRFITFREFPGYLLEATLGSGILLEKQKEGAVLESAHGLPERGLLLVQESKPIVPRGVVDT
jgi:hypothetical protein